MSDQFDAFVTYFEFERTWVGRRNTNPIYAIKLNKWNMRDKVHNDLLTTNNHVEGFHNKFSTIVGHRNPTVWTWLDAVRANQNLSFNALARHGGGVPGPLSNASVIARQRQLKGVLREYGTLSLFEYLEMCTIGM